MHACKVGMHVAHVQIIHQRHYVDKCLTTYSVDLDLKIEFQHKKKSHTCALAVEQCPCDIMMALKDAIRDRKSTIARNFRMKCVYNAIIIRVYTHKRAQN